MNAIDLAAAIDLLSTASAGDVIVDADDCADIDDAQLGELRAAARAAGLDIEEDDAGDLVAVAR
jgi:hypothetical protein